MTYEEALSTLRDFIGCLVPARVSGIEYRRFEAFAKAIEALKKQIPKFPVRDKEYVFTWLWCCPRCGGRPMENYCANCGQAIDWSKCE